MKYSFRPSTLQDRDAIRDFLCRIFGSDQDQPYVQRDQMRWRFWEQSDAWPESRSYLLERDQQLVAHGTAWPLSLATTAEKLSGFNLIDWAADPGFSGAGVVVMRKMAEKVDVVYVSSGTEIARKMRAAMGFRPRNEFQIFSLPLRPVSQILTHQVKNWKTPLRLIRNLAWSKSGNRAVPVGWEAVAVPAAQIKDAPVPWPKPRGSLMVFDSTPALHQLLSSCPTVDSEFFLVSVNGRTAGYFSLVYAPRQARLVDAWIEPDDRDAWSALYALAVTRAKAHECANELVVYSSLDSTHEALTRCGFHPIERDALLLYDPRRNVAQDARIYFQMVHSDAAYLHSGRPQYLS